MLRAYIQRFDVTRNLKKFYKILKTKQARDQTKRVKIVYEIAWSPVLRRFFFPRARGAGADCEMAAGHDGDWGSEFRGRERPVIVSVRVYDGACL